MVEFIENWLQIIVLLFCVIFGIRLCLQSRQQQLWLIVGAWGSFLLGDMVYTLHLWVQGEFPFGFSAADLAYIGGYLFLIAADSCWVEQRKREPCPNIRTYRSLALLGAFFTVVCNGVIIWEMYRWDYSIGGTVVYILPMAVLAYLAVLTYCVDKGPYRLYHGCLLLFVLIELAMFMLSAFGLLPLYLVFDILLTFLASGMLLTLQKGAKG